MKGWGSIISKDFSNPNDSLIPNEDNPPKPIPCAGRCHFLLLQSKKKPTLIKENQQNSLEFHWIPFPSLHSVVSVSPAQPLGDAGWDFQSLEKLWKCRELRNPILGWDGEERIGWNVPVEVLERANK